MAHVFQKHGEQLIIMLGGGDKSSQPEDIKAAKRLAAKIKGEKDE